jgi:zinc/manganese transport system substrate-binding protein
MSKSRSAAAVAAMLVALGGALTACGTTSTTSQGRLRVVAAESPWGQIAAAIGGPDAQVTSLVAAANVDPHEYQPTATAAAAVAQAAVVVDNGLGYDEFMGRLLATGTAEPRRVVTAATVLGVTGKDANPHLWYALERVPTVAKAIEVAMSAADPAHRAGYSARLTRFDASLAPVLNQVATIARLHAGDPVAQTERVAGYLLAEAHLVVASPPAFALSVESGQSPPAQATEAMDMLLANRQVRALVLNSQTETPVTDTAAGIARANQVPVVAVTETVQPPTSSFVSWQARQLRSLEAALDG